MYYITRDAYQACHITVLPLHGFNYNNETHLHFTRTRFVFVIGGE